MTHQFGRAIPSPKHGEVPEAREERLHQMGRLWTLSLQTAAAIATKAIENAISASGSRQHRSRRKVVESRSAESYDAE